MEDKIVTFHRFVVRSRRRCEYPLSHIINMDETPMRFELPATRTLEFTGTGRCRSQLAVRTSRALLLHLQKKRNLPQRSSLKASGSLILTHRRECRSQCTNKAAWIKEIFISSLVYFRFVLWRIKLLSTCSRARIISMHIWLSSSGSLFTFDRRLIISALMFGFNGNSLKYFFLNLSFLGTKEWVQIPKQAL